MLAPLAHDERHHLGETLAHALLESAKISVGTRQSEPYDPQATYTAQTWSSCAVG